MYIVWHLETTCMAPGNLIQGVCLLVLDYRFWMGLIVCPKLQLLYKMLFYNSIPYLPTKSAQMKVEKTDQMQQVLSFGRILSMHLTLNPSPCLGREVEAKFLHTWGFLPSLGPWLSHSSIHGAQWWKMWPFGSWKEKVHFRDDNVCQDCRFW